MAHIHELYDFVVTAIIVHDSKVLLVHHPRYDKWLPMGGHIELDEDPEEALFREIQEETGLEVEILSSKAAPDMPGRKFILMPNYIDVHEANAPHKHIGLVYFARAKNNNHVLSDEHLDIQWFGESDLDKPTYNLGEDIKFYCREALELAER